jgi:hypothetical protein
VPDDAELAVVCFRLSRVKVRGLSEGQRRHQEKTQHRDGEPETTAWHLVFAEMEFVHHA